MGAQVGKAERATVPAAHAIDNLDRRILTILQTDATYPVSKIALRVGLSTTACWNRIQRLEESGVIVGKVALLSPQKVGFQLVAFVTIEAGNHSAEWQSGFDNAIGKMPEVLEIYRMAGDIDYILRVVVQDMAAYDRFYKRLTGIIEMRKVATRFAIEQVKATTILPLMETSLAASG
jgi:Lrp/AsnC family transcriptional regulator